jgi:hypothetical protein
MKAILLMISEKVKAHLLGQTGASTLANGSQENSMVWELILAETVYQNRENG